MSDKIVYAKDEGSKKSRILTKPTKALSFSSSISDFCDMVTRTRRDYEWNNDEISRLDRLTQDYLHQLELGELGYKERAKIATKLAECRRLRRASKDTVETLKPFIDFIDSDKGRQAMNLMKEALGKTRKIEENMKTRCYRYKVLKE